MWALCSFTVLKLFNFIHECIFVYNGGCGASNAISLTQTRFTYNLTVMFKKITETESVRELTKSKVSSES